MKAMNNRVVTMSVVRFSIFLIMSAGLAIGIYSSFVKTSAVEMRKLTEISSRYDKIRMQQVLLTESVDSLYHYAMLLNSGDIYINQSALFTMVSVKSIRFNEEIETMNNDDIPVYKKLGVKLDNLLQLKDSIRQSNINLEVLRDEYVRCMNKNKDMNRKLFNGRAY
ncbi:MAG: hypothetical protein LBE91_00455 [Tannerella sp.]|nr:hypothetical protein [Tannerella sp.]